MGCKLSGSSIYALVSDFTFANNQCKTSTIFINNSIKGCMKATITGNQFNSGLNSSTGVIMIDPTYDFYKVYNIQNNSFRMQSGDACSIRITSSTSGSSYTMIAIQGNNFYQGTTPIIYQSSININYSMNTAFGIANPTSTGNLVSNYNVNF